MQEVPTNNDYDVKLAIARERGKQAVELFNAALAIEKTDPLQAVKLLYKAALFGYRRASEYLYEPSTPEKIIPEETINGIIEQYKNSKPKEIFYAGLQACSGIGDPRCKRLAFRLFELAANKNFANAQYNLGWMYRKGLGVKQNYEEALKWYLLAAKQNNAYAQYSYGCRYFNGEGVEQNYLEALKWFLLAAEQNNASAQFNLGYMYEDGLGVEKNHAKALKWYRLAAEQNNASAQFKLGYMYLEGRGVETNYAEALKWFRLAAEQNHPSAQNSLGRRYFNGEGIEQNHLEALKWFRLAAEQNNEGAQQALNEMYSNNVVPFDSNNAEDYLRDLHVLKIKSARRYLQRLADIPVFCGLYRLAMIDDEKIIQKLCGTAPDDFYSELIKDLLIEQSVRHRWIEYLFNHHVFNMALDNQIKIAMSIFYSGAASHETAIKLTTIFRKTPKDHEQYAEAQSILHVLTRLADEYHPYLAHYHANQSGKAFIAEKTELAEYVINNPAKTLDELETNYCEAEINYSAADFKVWLEAKIGCFEAVAKENNLSPSEATFFHELCFRLAQINYDEFLSQVKKERDALSYRITHRWRSEPVIIPPHITTLLKKIPEQHTRFESAKEILGKCERLAREPAVVLRATPHA